MADTGPAHYLHAEDLASQAEAASDQGNLELASALAAIGQVHATLAAAAASTLHPDFTEYAVVRDWKDATGQD